MKPVSYGDVIMSAVDEDSTLLSGLGIDIIKADITNVDVSDSKIEANGKIYFTENIDFPKEEQRYMCEKTMILSSTLMFWATQKLFMIL